MTTIKKQHYHLLGWTSNDAIVLRTLLRLMEYSLPHHWDESYSVSEAMLLLIDISTPDNAQLYLQMVARYPDKWVIPYGYGNELKGYERCLSKPVRTQGQTGLLEIFTNLQLSTTPMGGSMPSFRPTTVQFHTAGDPCLLPVWEALQEGRSFALHFDSDTDSGLPFFVFDGQAQHCYALERPNRWLRCFEGSFENLGLSQSGIEKILKKSNYYTYPLSSMRWCLALLLWDGAPSPQTAHLSRFKLQRWPDFTLVPNKPQHIVISGCLSKKAMTADAIATTIKQPIALVQNFLNACAAMGLLVEEKTEVVSIHPTIAPIQTQPSNPTVAANGKSDLFAALLHKLRGGKTWVKPV